MTPWLTDAPGEQAGLDMVAGATSDGPSRPPRITVQTGPNGPVAIADGTVFAAGREGSLVAIDAATGHQAWGVTTDVRSLGPPAVADGTVYVGAGPDSDSGTVFALDAADGTERWHVETRTVKWDYPRNGLFHSPAVIDDIVYAATAPGDVYAIQTP